MRAVSLDMSDALRRLPLCAMLPAVPFSTRSPYNGPPRTRADTGPAMAIEQLPEAPETASVPTFDALMWPTLQALKAMGGSGSNEELLNKVIEIADIPPEVQAVQHTDHRQTKINYNLAWAKTYLKKVGAIDNSSRGVWSITKPGESLTPAEVALVPSRVRKLVNEEKRARTNTEAP